jgi:hypothetical protein
MIAGNLVTSSADTSSVLLKACQHRQIALVNHGPAKPLGVSSAGGLLFGRTTTLSHSIGGSSDGQHDQNHFELLHDLLSHLREAFHARSETISRTALLLLAPLNPSGSALQLPLLTRKSVCTVLPMVAQPPRMFIRIMMASFIVPLRVVRRQ